MADIHFIDIFFKASLLVKSVMLVLVFFSITSWTIIIQRARVLNQVMRRAMLFENKFWSGVNLTRLYQEAALQAEHLSGIEKIFHDGFKAYSRLQHIHGCVPAAVVDGSVRAMRVAFNREIEKVEIYIPLLATVGSVSPYIGLLGTVWGIMQAFVALGGVKQATLPMVAPAIAEALIATAIGLVAAIPAVIAHNRFSLQANKIEQNYTNFMEEFTAILHRQAFSGQ